MKKYKDKYKTGMIFRSKKDPWTDLVIDYVVYTRVCESAYIFNMNSIICWTRRIQRMVPMMQDGTGAIILKFRPTERPSL